jgi:UDP-N-acetylmuramoyl-tripeptide--D-alanyl-D-alanine ligase
VPELSLADLARACGGTLLRGDPESTVDNFVINTRMLRPGGVFFALKGTRTDGHKFLGDAAKRDALAAVIEREPQPDEPAPAGLIRVDDATEALARSGSFVRKRLGGGKWIAVTGSNGKTTTKELIAAALSAAHRVHRTSGNLNNHLGVPLTLLACPDDAEAIVLELAMSAAGEIAMLAEMTDPDIGLITNVRAVHLKYFRSLDDIAAAKGELFAVMRNDSTAVVNLDDPHVRVQAARHTGPRVTFGRHQEADLRIEELVNRFIPGSALTIRYQGQPYRVELGLGGGHAAFDALAALAVVVACGDELEPAIERMAHVEPGPGRGKVHRLARDIVLIDDSYNSSPAALASVLETLRLSEPRGRKVLVMGDMLELGPVEGALHREAGKRAASTGVNLLVAVGPLSRQSAESARRGGVQEVHLYSDAKKAAASIGEYLRDGDMIVVKGSRGMRLERVVEALIEGFGQEAA